MCMCVCMCAGIGVCACVRACVLCACVRQCFTLSARGFSQLLCSAAELSSHDQLIGLIALTISSNSNRSPLAPPDSASPHTHTLSLLSCSSNVSFSPPSGYLSSLSILLYCKFHSSFFFGILQQFVIETFKDTLDSWLQKRRAVG